MFYYTYVLLCKDKDRKKFYIGFTDNLLERIKRHKLGLVKTTKSFESIELIYYETCLSKKDAMTREKSLKTGFGRKYLKNRMEDFLNNSGIS